VRRDLDTLRSALLELDVDPRVLRAHPNGDGWLSPELRALVESRPACREELRTFVRSELELFDSAREGADPFFTARVVESLPPPLPGTALTPFRRALILAGFNVLAAVTAYVVLWLWAPESLISWLDSLAGWIDGGLDAAAIWVLALGVVLLGLASLLPRAHRPLA
jgi:hypothetical protein